MAPVCHTKRGKMSMPISTLPVMNVFALGFGMTSRTSPHFHLHVGPAERK